MYVAATVLCTHSLLRPAGGRCEHACCTCDGAHGRSDLLGARPSHLVGFELFTVVVLRLRGWLLPSRVLYPANTARFNQIGACVART